MATVTKRVNGALVETDDINDQAALAGVPVTPATPVGGAAIGANPDQAKMLGSSANKQAVVEEAVKPAETLQTAQRVAAPTTTATDVQQQAADKAAKVNALGSLSTRVEAMVQGELAKLQAPTGTVSQTAIETLPVEVREQATTLLNAVIANPNDPTALAAATQFFKDKGLATGENFSPQQFIATAQESLGKAAADQVANEVKVGGLPLEANESAALDAIFGDTWREWTVPQLAQKIEDQKQAQFSTVSSLQAELKTATGNQRQMLLKQLEDMGQVGVTGVEAGVDDIAKQIDSADEVTIGEDSYKVEDILKDEEISKLVTKMLSDPKLAEQVAKTNPEFAAWVKSNAEGLAKLATDVEATQGTVREIDAENKKAAEVGGITLSDDVMSAIIPDWGKTTGAAYDTSSSGILSYLKDPNLDPAKATSIANALQAASTDPALLRTLSGLTAEQFGYAYDLAQSVDADKTGLLSRLTGVDPTTGFITDPAKQAEMVKYRNVTESLTKFTPTDPDMAKTYNIAMNDPALLEAIKSGGFRSMDARLMGEHPERWEEYKTTLETTKRMDAAVKGGDIDGALKIMFGTENVDAATVNAEYANVKRVLAIDPTDKAAQEKLRLYEKLDSNKDGKFDKDDLSTLQAKLTGDLYEGAKTFDIRGALTTGSKNDSLKSYQDAKLYAPSGANLYVDTVSKILKDQKLTMAEIASLPADMQEKILGNADLLKKYNVKASDFKTYKSQVATDKMRSDFMKEFKGFLPKGQAATAQNIGGAVYTLAETGQTDKIALVKDYAKGQLSLYDRGTPEFAYWSEVIGKIAEKAKAGKAKLDARKKLEAEEKKRKEEEKAKQEKEGRDRQAGFGSTAQFYKDNGIETTFQDGKLYLSKLPPGATAGQWGYEKGRGWYKAV